MGANGRMGRAICQLVLGRPDLRLAGVGDTPQHLDTLASYGCPRSSSLPDLLEKSPEAVVIDFTAPAVSVKSAEIASEFQVPIVIGTTGLDEIQTGKLDDMAKKIPVFWSANMSIGLNALVQVLPQLCRLLGPGYDMEIVEIHHRHKKDAPSGTALVLGESLATSRGWQLADVRRCGREGLVGERPENEIGIAAVRGGDVAGVHTIYFMGDGERIELAHHAHSRENFAAGAVRAACWLKKQQPGRLYGMADLLHDQEQVFCGGAD